MVTQGHGPSLEASAVSGQGHGLNESHTRVVRCFSNSVHVVYKRVVEGRPHPQGKYRADRDIGIYGASRL